MQFLAAWALLLTLLGGCENPPPTPTVTVEVQTPAAENTKLTSLQDIVGYVLTCDTANGKAYVYAFAPHILGIWDDPEAKRIEYFVSQFITKKDELIFELLVSGEANMRTSLYKPGELKNRRLMMKMRDGKVFVMVAHGLSAKDNTPIKPQQFECARGPLISKSFTK
ncbi:MAG: hypothetical protein A2X86_02285 [Bdellovibrionales bacterium GWA2_49_15]|nr:MAG: hypothetical protein A2X86_02285 [Bdellovibrionales bacterium GWA2_49_15]